jgi:predicted lipid-binding transport protein (Tim44 family)
MTGSIGQGPQGLSQNSGVQKTSSSLPEYESFTRMSEAGKVDQLAKRGGVIGGLVGGSLGGLLKTTRGMKLAGAVIGFTLAQVFVIPGRAIARAISNTEIPVKENKVDIPPGSTKGRV